MLQTFHRSGMRNVPQNAGAPTTISYEFVSHIDDKFCKLRY